VTLAAVLLLSALLVAGVVLLGVQPLLLATDRAEQVEADQRALTSARRVALTANSAGWTNERTVEVVSVIGTSRGACPVKDWAWLLGFFGCPKWKLELARKTCDVSRKIDGPLIGANQLVLRGVHTEFKTLDLQLAATSPVHAPLTGTLPWRAHRVSRLYTPARDRGWLMTLTSPLAVPTRWPLSPGESSAIGMWIWHSQAGVSKLCEGGDNYRSVRIVEVTTSEAYGVATSGRSATAWVAWSDEVEGNEALFNATWSASLTTPESAREALTFGQLAPIRLAVPSFDLL